MERLFESRAIKYLISGGSAAVFNLGTLYVLTKYGHFHYLLSELVAFFIAFVMSFTLQKLWTFRNTRTDTLHLQFVSYLTVVLVALAGNMAILYVLVQFGHWWYVAAEVVAGGVIAVGTFFAYRDLVFHPDHGALAPFSKRFFYPALLGVISTLLALGGLWATGALTHTIYPSIIDDDLYYLASMNTVAHGYPNVGNPYYLEHRTDAAPAFTLPTRVAAIPLQLGASVSLTLAINFVLWSIVFVLLIYAMLRQCSFSEAMASAGALFLYAESYGFIMRPVVMQTILPVFLIYALGILLLSPKWKMDLGSVLIAATTAISFYWYGYLWQILGASVVMACLFAFYKGERRIAYKVGIAGVAGLMAGIPALLALGHQFADSVYLQTAVRIGLNFSHWPTIEEYYYGRWILIVMLAWFLLRRTIAARVQIDTLVYGLGFGLLLADLSNIVTGKELYIGDHVGRFITVYTIFMSAVFVREVLVGRYFMSLERRSIKVIVALLLLVLCLFALSNLRRSGPWGQIVHHEYDASAQMSGVLNWLSTQGGDEQVVLADDLLAAYLPSYTTDFSLYARGGALQVATNAEVTDRYLTARALGKVLTQQQLATDILGYGGAGEVVRVDQQNVQNTWCRTFRLDIIFGMWCNPIQNLESYEGAAYWNDLLGAWHTDKTHLAQKLAQYQVRYIAWPKERRNEIDLSKLVVTKVYEDSAYVVYELNAIQ